MSLSALGLAEAAAGIRDGRLSSAELVADCLKRIDEADRDIEAWAFLDRDYAMRQAEAADDRRKQGKATGPLHGVPLGIKDIFDTGDMPTEFGSSLWAGRTPRRDAAAVARLRAAGAVILGKTVTTEYAYFNPGKTRNPHNPAHTPGGSSSGSAAAVAALMVPGAIGSQTNGSVIRPAAFCGVVGFKPTHGLIPRSGALLLSRALDHVGVFARSVDDAALLAQTLAGFDEEDPDTCPLAAPRFVEMAASEPPLPPRFAFVRSPAWKHVEQVTTEAFAELVEALGEHVSEVEIGPSFDRAIDMHRTVMEVEMAHNLHRDFEQGDGSLSQVLRALIERGRMVAAVDYTRALAGSAPLNAALDGVFDEYDAILTPSAPGPAPRGLDTTGNPVFCSTWTYLGTPAVNLPLLQSESGLPIGVQLVGRRGNDARLLRTANWLVRTLGKGGGDRAAPAKTSAKTNAKTSARRAKTGSDR
ncbi:amidase [Bradyrhizobium sp. LMTR 3]|uniref:amidase n=1 Tax=Bradyrhizobium sp. LMTR 3 TaxID=189873 RepID=UPI000810AA44|nr:amidase [Bradyrhizobium sp. LMTR 3]OCK57575.1 glutamyl-tRNA amidotransferase [Bradyrhizobium sp. LMTR 3]